jgi:hypothetical protein
MYHERTRDAEDHRGWLMSGFALLAYWLLGPRTWQAAFSASWYMAISFMLAGLVLLAWYASVVTSALDWLIQSAHHFATVPVLAPLAKIVGSPPQGSQVKAVEDIGIGLARAFAIILPLTPLLIVVDLSRLSKFYLQNAEGDDGVGLRERIRLRLRKRFLWANAQDYERVIVVAHSFGTLPVVDLLADWQAAEDFGRLKVITLGSPAGIFAFKSAWMKQQVAAATAKHPALGWFDFRLDRDFLSSGLVTRSTPTSRADVVFRKLATSQGVLAGLFGDIHMNYLAAPETMSEILRA